MLSTEELEHWLKGEDASRMSGRVARLRFLTKEYRPSGDGQFFHGELSQWFFEEARWCFVNGQFIACVLVCQCFLESSIRSLLGAGGQNYGVSDKWAEDAGFCSLIEKAKEDGILSPRQARDCHSIRQMRVEYVHARPVFSTRHVARRMIRSKKTLPDLSEADARRAMKVMLQINQAFGIRV